MRGDLHHCMHQLLRVTGITKTSTMIIARQIDDEKFTSEYASFLFVIIIERF